MAQYYRAQGLQHAQQGRYRLALEAYNKELVERQVNYGNVNPQHPDIADSYTKIAGIELIMGKISHALENYHKSLAIHQSNHKGGNHPLVGEAYTNIAVCYQKQAKYQLALQSLEQALLVLRICYKDKPDHQSIFSVHVRMGDVHREMAEHLLAFNEIQNSLKRYEATCTNESEKLAMSEVYTVLGALSVDTGDCEQAIACYDNAISIQQDIIPPGCVYHPDTAQTLNYLGNVELKRGDYKAALKSIWKAINYNQKTFGKESNHFLAVDPIISLGRLKCELGHFDDALNKCFFKVLSMLTKTFGEKANHPKIADVYNDIGEAYEAKGDFRQAHSYHHKASNIRDVVYADVKRIHPDIASGLEKICSVYCKQGKYQRAYEVLTKSNEMKKQVYELEEDVRYHPAIARGHRLAADISILVCEYSAAQSGYVFSKPINKAYAKNLDMEESIADDASFGNVFRLQCEFDKSVEYYSRSLKKCENTQQHRVNHSTYAKISMSVAAVHEDKGDLKTALLITTTAYETLKGIYGVSHPIVPRTLARIADIKEKLDHHDEALLDYFKAVERFRTIYGNDLHPDIGLSFTAIGNIYFEQRKWNVAREYYTIALSRFRDIHGRATSSGKEIQHPHIADCYNNIGLVYCYEGDYKTAEQYMSKSLRMKKSIYDDCKPHLSLAESYLSLALYHLIQDEFTKSIELYQLCLDIRKLVYGTTHHLKVAEVYDRLGFAYDNLGSDTKALESYQQSLHLRISIMGEVEDDHAIALDYYNIGCMLVKLSKFTDAFPYYVRSLAMCTKIISGDKKKLYMASTFYNFGLVGHNIKGVDQADVMKYYAKARELFEQISPTHKKLGDIYENMGHIRFSQCEYQRAKDLHTKCLQIRKHHNTEENCVTIARAYENVATATGRLGWFSEARKHYEKALSIKRIVHGEKAISTDIAKSLHDLGTIFEELGMSHNAIKHHISALTMYRVAHDEEMNHPDIARCYSHIGLCFTHQHDLEQGLKYLLDSRDKLQQFYGNELSKHIGDGWPDITKYFQHRGELYHYQRSYKEAVENYHKAISILEVNHIRHPDIALNHYLIGYVYADQSQFQDALDRYYKALEVWKTFYDEHPDMADCYREIGWICEKQLKYNEAIENYSNSFAMRKTFYGEKNDIVLVYHKDLASVYRKSLEWDKCLENMFKILNLEKEMDTPNPVDLAKTLDEIADIHLQMCNESQYSYYHAEAKKMRDSLNKEVGHCTTL